MLPTLFHAIVHAQKTHQNKPPPEFTAFMLLFRQQSSPDGQLHHCRKLSSVTRCCTNLTPGLSIWKQIPAGPSTNKLKPKAAYVLFSSFIFSDHIPPTMCKISSIIAFWSILVIPLHIKINKNAQKHKNY